jgi:exodeoxyribonuclease V alpha subunit
MTDLWARLERLREQGALADLDVQFARFVSRLATSPSDELALAAALVSQHVGRGHVCADLAALARRVVLPADDDAPDDAPPIKGPPLARWRKALAASGVVGADGPLVLDDAGRLYLERYWCYERALAAALLERAAAEPPVDAPRLRADLERLFGESGNETDWQKVAAAVAALRRLCIVSGGPGTGKTTTVVRILALLAGAQDAPLRIALAAPTGKAAARMQEAVRAAKASLPVSDAVRARIPDEASTLHRLLGARPQSVRTRHDAEHPLPCDVLVVDEASMVDLALMTRVVAALPRNARLVLLGDRDQLASVQAGAVLGDACGVARGFPPAFAARLGEVVGRTMPIGADVASPLASAVVLLDRSYRFDDASGIGRLAAAVNAGHGERAWDIVTSGATDDLVAENGTDADLARRALEGYGPYLETVRRGGSPEAAFAAFAAFRVLCAHRRGPRGADEVNRLVTGALGERDDWYPGRPILVTENDHALRLYNGDVGLALRDPMSGELRVFVEGDGGRLRRMAPARLPPHETTWAMTVHKSQGSEFDHVLLVLPQKDSRVMSRELLYTAITRARRRVVVYGTDVVFRTAAERRLVRSSGLRDALWGPGA